MMKASTMEAAPERDRRFYVARVVACFMVVLLHVSAEQFIRLDAGWWAGNVIDSLVRCSVPLFFMIAGATLLRRDEPLGLFFRKRAVRVLPPLMIWSFFYMWWLWYNGGGPANWLLAFLQGPSMYHLWYFYALVGVYAALPIARKFYLHSTRREQLCFIIAWLLVASVIPTGYDLLYNRHCEGGIRFDHLQRIYHLGWFMGYMGFVLLGAWIADGKNSAAAGWGVYLLASAATALGTWWLTKQFGQPCEFFFVYLSPFVVAASWGLFKALMSLRDGPTPRWLVALSDSTLGIYGLHVFVIDPVFPRLGLGLSPQYPWLSIIAMATGVFLLAFAVVFVLRLLPPLRRLF